MKEKDRCFNQFQKKFLKENKSDFDKKTAIEECDKENQFLNNNQQIIREKKMFEKEKNRQQVTEIFECLLYNFDYNLCLYL